MALEDQVFGWDHFLSNILGHISFTAGSYLLTFWLITFVVLREVLWGAYDAGDLGGGESDATTITTTTETTRSNNPWGMPYELFLPPPHRPRLRRIHLPHHQGSSSSNNVVARRRRAIKPEISPLARTNTRHHPKSLRGTTEQIRAPSKRKSPHTWLWCLQGSILPLALIALPRCRLASRTKTKTLSSRKVLGTPRLYEGMCKSESPVTTKGANVSLPVFRM